MQSTPNANDSQDVIQLLRQVQTGDRQACDRLFRLIYSELRRIAHRELRDRWDRQTLDTTELVEEAYLKLAEDQEVDPRSRTHFLAFAALALRRVLTDYAQKRLAERQGASLALTTVTGGNVSFNVELGEMPALDKALKELERVDPRMRKIVEYRLFGGLAPAEIGRMLGMTERAVERDWVKARAWLYKELYPEEPR